MAGNVWGMPQRLLNLKWIRFRNSVAGKNTVDRFYNRRGITTRRILLFEVSLIVLL